MPRPSREILLMEMAQLIARRATCGRRQVGAILTRESRIISMGYTGAPPGQPHCSPEICNLQLPCTRTVHAEANAIAFAARYGMSTKDCALYTTASPCMDCAKLIISAGVCGVFYLEEYRDTAPLLLLRECGIYAEKLPMPTMLALEDSN